MAARPGARNLPVVLAVGFALAGCASSSGPHFARHGRHYAAGRPHYTVAPYQVNGVWYYPKVDYDYDRTGTASWYGPGFDHRATADGETYDMNGLTAAHKTLPLPSVVEVTNLQNGRELRLRVNDRGPFVGTRLIDLSRRAAQLLGFAQRGTAPVRVRVLKDPSIRVAAAAMHGDFGEVGYAAADPAARTEVAAAVTRQVRPMRLAEAVPPSLRAREVIAAPLPSAAAPSPTPAPSPPPLSVPPSRRAEEVVAAPLPPAAPPIRSTAPRPVVAAAAPRHFWPSLIPEAHAEPLPSGFGLAVMRAAGRSASRQPHRGGIFVQAGAFAVAENARRVRARIAALGSVEILSASVNGTALYRVRLGPAASEAEARRLLREVVERGFPGARLVGR